MNPEAITKQFLDSYYETASLRRSDLINFYTNDSCFTYEGDACKGIQAIREKLESMTYTSIKYEFDEHDIQPGSIQGSLLIVVIGGLKIEDNPPFKFTQTFQLCPNGKGGYYLHNDILRLIYGAA